MGNSCPLTSTGKVEFSTNSQNGNSTLTLTSIHGASHFRSSPSAQLLGGPSSVCASGKGLFEPPGSGGLTVLIGHRMRTLTGGVQPQRCWRREGFVARVGFTGYSLGSGSRYQWTWKDPRQTALTLTLSARQYAWLNKAIAEHAAAQKMLAQMRQISHRILMDYVLGPRRRKHLSLKRLHHS